MLTSVFGALIPLTLQSDLYSFLMGLANVAPVENRSEGADWAGRPVVADASMASQLWFALVLARVPGVPATGSAGAATLGGMAASILTATTEFARASLLPAMAPPGPVDDAISMGQRLFVPHSFSDIPRAASMWALAAVALPGVGGLVILTLAGVRIGYRQAKAGVKLHATGIAHFARPGPIGVVRSGSLVFVRPRGVGVVRPGTLSPKPRLEVA